MVRFVSCNHDSPRVRRKNSVAAIALAAPTPNSLGGIASAIVIAETTVLAAATLSSSPREERKGQKREPEGDGGDGTPAAASPSLDIKGRLYVWGGIVIGTL